MFGLGTWVGVDGEGGAVDTASANPEPVVDASLTQTVVNPHGRYRYLCRGC